MLQNTLPPDLEGDDIPGHGLAVFGARLLPILADCRFPLQVDDLPSFKLHVLGFRRSRSDNPGEAYG